MYNFLCQKFIPTCQKRISPNVLLAGKNKKVTIKIILTCLKQKNHREDHSDVSNNITKGEDYSDVSDNVITVKTRAVTRVTITPTG